MEIQYIDAPAGSGKTRFMIAEVCEMAHWGHKVLIIQPTKDLIEQTYSDINAFCGGKIIVTRIHEETAGKGNVTQEIMDHFKSADNIGQIFLITHASFDLTPFLYGSKYWDLFIDECPQSFKPININAKRSHNNITDNIEYNSDCKYVQILPKNAYALRDIISSSNHDDTKKVFRDAAKLILSDGWDCYVYKKDYELLISGKSKSGNLNIYGTRNKNIIQLFKSCTIISARIKETLFYKFMIMDGASFVEYGDPVYNSVRKYKPHNISSNYHNNGNLVDFYAPNINYNSKSIQTQNPNLRGELLEFSKKEFEGSEFIFQENKSINGKAVKSTDLIKNGGIELSGVAHGMNIYSHIDNVLIYASFNPAPDQSHFLNYIGLSNEEISIAIHCHGIYQSVMRCSLRDPNSETRKKVILPDQRSAEYMHNVFPGSKIQTIATSIDLTVAGKPGTKKKHLSNAEKQKAYRERKKAEMTPDNDNVQTIEDERYEFPIKKEEVTSENSWIMNIYETLYDTGGTTEIIFKYVNEISEYMRNESLHSYNKKNDAKLFNFTRFKGDHKRGTHNVIGTNVLMIDNDGGGICENDFSLMMPNIKMIISNSYSSNKENHKWRAIIPMTRVVSFDEYRDLFNHIIMVANDNGYTIAKTDDRQPYSKAHGIDLSKNNPENVFYFPCQGRDPEGSFFIECIGDDRQILDPDDWLAQTQEEPVEYDVEQEEWEGVDAEKIQNAIQKWRDEGSQPGNSYKGFKDLMTTIYYAGMSRNDMLSLLHEEAQHCKSTEDRRKNAIGLVDWAFKNLNR